ncbi:MAG TPA: amidohydrolase family protein [Pseudomonadales bacterium]|nr:amidohydrolase family protein [Pseudomonadales bacterium]
MRALLAAAMVLLAACGEPIAPVDLRIVDARIVDGTGAPARTGEVHVRDGRIVHVGPTPAAPINALRVIDAGGRVVAPGFIDPHSHGDAMATPEFENFLAMGVTTVTLGQDGDSPAVEDLGAYLEGITGLGPNLAMFVGHGTLRELAGIGRDPVPDEAGMARMLNLLERSLDHAFGLSTGLEYNPGLNAGDDEMLALAGIVGARDRVIMSHVRNEDDPVLAQSLAELIRQGGAARVHVAHLKSVYGKGAARGREILALLEAARAEGVEITADVYPYTASYTGLALLFPVWAKAPEQFAEAKVSRRAELADYLRRRVEGRNGPAATLLGTAPHAGKTLADLAAELGKPFEEVLIDDLGPQGGSAAYFIMDEDLQSEFIRAPGIAICSDGSPTGFHPRGHGTFARIIETYVRARGVLSLEAAVHKMTALPARIIGLGDRGTLAEGKAADLVLFDPARVHETATYEQPMALAEGFDLVVVGGVVVRENGVLSDARPGRVLRPRAVRVEAVSEG